MDWKTVFLALVVGGVIGGSISLHGIWKMEAKERARCEMNGGEWSNRIRWVDSGPMLVGRCSL
jgi:hypothetical protein